LDSHFLHVNIEQELLFELFLEVVGLGRFIFPQFLKQLSLFPAALDVLGVLDPAQSLLFGLIDDFLVLPEEGLDILGAQVDL